jgi:ubiquinol-cytochrome c reductase cytochrome c1 subunit
MKTLIRNLLSLAKAPVAAGVVAVAAVALSFNVSPAWANTETVALDTAPINLKDQASLQRGARNFVNYCMNCHSAQFMRYSHLTQIGLTEDQIKNNLMFGTDKIGDTMVSALDAKDAKAWFGGAPPDLTLVARVRGSDWLYTFLRSFYRDDTTPSGWNNRVFKNVGMPHVLHDLQGTQLLAKVGEKKGHGEMEPVMGLVVGRAGKMSATEYDLFVKDLVNYLTFMGEPARPQRTQMGVMILFFLVLAFFAALWLKNEYWKDVK